MDRDLSIRQHPARRGGTRLAQTGGASGRDGRGLLYSEMVTRDWTYETSLVDSERNPLLKSEDVRNRKGTALPSRDYDSLDYDTCYNVPYKEMVHSYSKYTYYQMQVMKWVLVGIIGVLTGTVAFLIDIIVQYLLKAKYSLFEQVYHATHEEGTIVLMFLELVGFNILFAFIASFLVIMEPVAAGSGIPEIKCYLNGVKIPHVTRVSTLVSKAVGVLFSVAGGFLVGKEGPMIHSGAIIGAGVPQFRSMLFKKFMLPYPYFRSDRDKRDFVSSGAAAGVAAAFGAPIGGVLFSLEEGSSFWNQALTWRTLFCAFCSTFTLNLFLSAISGITFGTLSSPSLVDFGTFTRDESKLWNAYHLIIFIIMGAIGGLLGALFNSINTQITIYRLKYLQRRRRSWNYWRIFEAILIVIVTTTSVFIAAMLLGTCIPVHNSADDNIDKTSIAACSGDNSFVNETKNFFCPKTGNRWYSTYYNDLGTLLFNSQEVAIKQLFHQNGAFTLPTLFIMFIIYFPLACWTYGAAIPSGLFIPCLLIGAIYGRFVATVFSYLSSAAPGLSFLSNLYPGTYALIGAASFLGGVVRMTISLTVILIESTNEIDYGLPIMLTLMVAKWVGDLFNKGLYDIHIELKQTPLLEWEPPDQMEKLTAEDVMNSTLRYMYPITRVRSVERLLRTTAHSAFLIVTPIDISEVPERPTNVTSMHPQLYSRMSFVEGEDTATDPDGLESEDFADDDVALVEPEGSVNSPTHVHRQRVTAPAPHRAAMRDPNSRSRTTCPPSHGRPYRAASSPGYVALYPNSGMTSLTVSYSLPQHSQGLGIQGAYTEERPARERKPLVFHGIILRTQLVMLLKNRIFFNEDEGPKSQPHVSHQELVADYPRYPTIFDVLLTDEDRGKLMDLSLFMNPSPYTISNNSLLPQVFNLFRTMGLRHLPVIRDSGIVVGIITRHDLAHETLHELYKKRKAERREKRRKEKRLRKKHGRGILVEQNEAESIGSPVRNDFGSTSYS